LFSVALGPLDTQAEAESVLSYLTCRLTRLLILLHKPSQHVTRKVYTFVPSQSWDRRWTDADLYAKYGISPSEIEFIEKVVRPMDLTKDLLGDVTVDETDDE
jgi:site-specific DNA-methyltransferase (adenine-specific)